MASAPPPEGDAGALDAGEEPEVSEEGSDWSSDEEDLEEDEAWQIGRDPASGAQYYYNIVTEETTWEEPEVLREARKRYVSHRGA